MFLLSFLLLIFCSLLKMKIHNRRQVFILLYVLLSLMVVFQDTIGADFYSYKALYYSIPKNFERMSLAEFMESNRDLLFSFLVISFDKIGISYIGFRMILSALMMLFFFRFIKDYCSYSILSLFVFYALYYIYWVYSCFRQGFCMSYFLCILFPFAINKKYAKFYLLSIPMWGIHVSSIVYLLAPFIINYNLTRKKIAYIFVFSILVYFLSSSFSSMFLLFDRMAGYMELDPSDNKYLAFAFRILIILPMLFIDPNRFDNRFFKISCNAFLFSLLFYCINTQMYPSDVNFFNFPYLSIFSDESVKKYYREYYEISSEPLYYLDFF